MATREELILEVTAKLDQAQSDVATLQGQLDDLQAGAEVGVAAAVEGGEEVDALSETVEELDGTEAEVAVEADAEDAADTVEGVSDVLEDLDGSQAEVAVEADADDAIDSVEEVADTVDDLDGATAEVAVEADTGGAADDMEEVAESLASVEAAGAGAAVSLGSVISKLGPVAAIAAGMGAAAVGAYEFVGAVEELALFSGAAYEDTSRLLAVMQDFTGIEVGRLENVIGRMTDKFEKMPELAEQLGINVEAASDPLDLFVQTVDALNSGQLSATDRLQIGMQIFGRGGMKAVNEIAASIEGPLADSIAAVSEERIISDADIAAADELEAAIGNLKGTLAGITQDVGGPLLQLFTPLLNLLGEATSLIPGVFDPLIDLVTGERTGIAEISEEFADFVQLMASGKDEAEAWQAAFGNTTGLRAHQAAVEDTNRLMSQGMSLQEAMFESFGLEGQAALGAAKALGILNDETDSTTLATEEATAATDEYNRKLEAAGRAISDVVDELPALAAGLADALDLGDVGVDLQVDEAKIRQTIDDTATAIQEHIDEHGAVDWGVVLDPTKSAEGFDAALAGNIAKLRDDVQEGIVNAFESGGAPAAQAWADSFIPQLIALGMTPDQAYAILGLGPGGKVDAVIDVAVNEALAAKAVSILDALASTEDPRVAPIQIALAQGQIDGELAYLAGVLLAHEMGIAVYPTVDENTTQAEIDAAQAWLDGQPVNVALVGDTTQFEDDADAATEPRTADVEVDDAGTVDEFATDADTATADRTTQVLVPKSDSLGAMQDLIDHVARPRTVPFTVTADNAGQIDDILDGVARPSEDGRIAPIFALPTNTGPADSTLDRLAMPTEDGRIAPIFALPTNVANADTTLDNIAKPRTVHLHVVSHQHASGGGSTGGAQPDLARGRGAAPAATAAAAPTINLTLAAAVIGDRYDVQRVVRRALRGAVRLSGARQTRAEARQA